MSVEQLNHQLSLAHARITSQDRQIASQDQQIASQDQKIASQQTQLNKLTRMIGLPAVSYKIYILLIFPLISI
ncbi:unnamed protein product [Meloidogyne enterolobii]|uniref:Uncharacterized protein n=1 Tax=Meloidogyne enterolobii TaxID=390850 RepID=A0ACB0XZB1_MELEN